MNLTHDSARALRDGAIDAAAALDEALREALTSVDPTEHAAIKLAVGRAMATLFEEVLNPAIRAHPDLKPDEAAWSAIARAQANKRAGT